MDRLVAFVALVLPVLTHGGYTIRGHDNGTCKIYPTEGLVCSQVIGGTSVFEWGGISIEEYSNTMEKVWDDTMRQAGNIFSSECAKDAQKFFCLSWFPPCTEDGDPRRICMSTCSYLNDYVCKSIFDLVVDIGQSNVLPLCDRKMGDPKYNEAFVYYEYYNPWKDTPMYPSEEIDPTCVDDLSIIEFQGQCQPADCGEALTEYRLPFYLDPSTGIPEWKNPEDFDYCVNSAGSQTLDCTKCESWCEIPCDPYPMVYDSSTYELLHFAGYGPGLLSLPLNILILVVEWKKLKASTNSKYRKQPKKVTLSDFYLLLIAVFSIILCFMEAIPSLMMGKELRCNFQTTYIHATNPDSQHPYCKFGKLRLHVLQAQLFAVTATLYKVNRQFFYSASRKKRQVPGQMQALFGFLIFGLPSFLALLTCLLDADQLFENSRSYRLSQGGSANYESMHIPNRLRFAFTCGPRFTGPLTEMFVIHVPLLIAGFASTILSALIVHTLNSKAKQFGENGDILFRYAKGMVRFAVVSTVLIVINAIGTFSFIPRAIEFGQKMSRWTDCALTGVNFDEVEIDANSNLADHTSQDKSWAGLIKHCGDFEDFKAPSWLLVLLAFCNGGLPSLAFGLVFALPALTQLRQMIATNLGKIVPTASHASLEGVGHTNRNSVLISEPQNLPSSKAPPIELTSEDEQAS